MEFCWMSIEIFPFEIQMQQKPAIRLHFYNIHGSTTLCITLSKEEVKFQGISVL